MKTYIEYNRIDDKSMRDDKAIADIKSYLKGHNPNAWRVLLEEARKVRTADDFQSINYAMSFAGIHGFPVHAFGRRYCLVGYREWMMRDADGAPGIPVDEHGYRIESVESVEGE